MSTNLIRLSNGYLKREISCGQTELTALRTCYELGPEIFQHKDKFIELKLYFSVSLEFESLDSFANLESL